MLDSTSFVHTLKFLYIFPFCDTSSFLELLPVVDGESLVPAALAKVDIDISVSVGGRLASIYMYK